MSGLPMCDHGTAPGGREAAMTVLDPTTWCDPCIAQIVQALNDGGIRTVASCCGHGAVNGNIALADGRELIIAADYETARTVERALATSPSSDTDRSTE